VIINASNLPKRLMPLTLTQLDVTSRYLNWLHDKEITHYLELGFSPDKTLETLEIFVGAANDSSDELLLGIFTKDGSRHIGNIKLSPLCRNHNRADLGFLIGARVEWGKGLASEAIAAISRYAITELHVAKLAVDCYESNQDFAYTLEKAGVVQEACLPKHWPCHSVREDGLLFGVLPPQAGLL
jgi:[ribosomal protein S5]-alanine N-acetyltransferase